MTGRPFYADYVRHALRFYSRNLSQPHFKSEVDKNNWFSCERVIRNYSDRDKEIIVSAYGGFDTLTDNVYETSKKYGVNRNIIWDMMKEVERKIARRRGLL